MNFAEAILVVLLRQPVYEGDLAAAPVDGECTTEACTERLSMLNQTAAAIATVAKKEPRYYEQLDIAAAEITIGYFESHFAMYVLQGQCKLGKFKCDVDRNGEPRAIGFGQVWHWCTAAWSAVPGSYESLEATAQCVSTRWHGARFRCAGIAGAFSGYKANRCDWAEGPRRAAKYQSVRRELEVLMKS